MRHLKKDFREAAGRPAGDRGSEPVEPQAVRILPDGKERQMEITCPDDYSPIWRTAFALAHNVRFTRTPDVELMRRRAAISPAGAGKPDAAAGRKDAGTDGTDSSPAALFTAYEEETETIFLEAMEVDADSLHSLPEEEMTPGESAAAGEDRVTSLSFLISDSAFFECAPFVLHESAADRDRQKEAAVIPGQGENIVPPAVAQDTLTHLYRVVECRRPGQERDAGPLLPAQDMAAVAAQKQPSRDTAVRDDNARNDDIRNSEPAGEMQAPVLPETDSDGWRQLPAICPEMQDMPSSAESETPPAVCEGDIPALPAAGLLPTPLPHEREHRNSPPEIRPPAGCNHMFPPIGLLQKPVYKAGNIIPQEMLERSAGLLESVLEDFGVKGEIIHVRPGPVVTLYEFEPAPGVKSSRVIGLSDDIARSMSAVSARVAVIPGRNVIGIELPNAVREMVYLREIIESGTFQTTGYRLPLALGKNIGGEPVIAELAKMPHLLVAGTTGSGKSVAINTMILSLLYRMPPEKCRLIMVDPKMLELSIYDGIPHLLTPVVTDPKKAVTALKWAVREMEDRYRKMAKLGVRNIDGFNARVGEALERNETVMCTVQAGFSRETGEVLYAEEAMDLAPLPYIVIIVDEMADLMMVAGKEIEGAIQRLAQMARAAGIHLIMATQRPSVDVITGTIKANFPTRISFQVTSKIDSRTILGEQGAETLLGQGDMLHMIGGGRLVRVHGPFVSDREVEHVVSHLKMQGKPEYLATVTDSDEEETGDGDAAAGETAGTAAGNSGDDSEELYAQAVKVVMRDKKCSTSYIQRRLGIGYNKAASLVERMEEESLVGPANHVGKREILLNG